MQLIDFILNSLKSVIETSIGEGNFGIIVDRFPSKEIQDICAKYHKFAYNPNEYSVLQHAYSKGLSVPEPLGEWPEHRVFAMRRVFGETLDQLQNMKFSEDVAEEIEATVRDVCKHIRHNDLLPRNIMLEDINIVDGVVVNAIPYVIDFGQSRVKKTPDQDTSEAESILSWVRIRTKRALKVA